MFISERQRLSHVTRLVWAMNSTFAAMAGLNNVAVLRGALSTLAPDDISGGLSTPCKGGGQRGFVSVIPHGGQQSRAD